MRAKIVGMLVLLAIMALTTGFSPHPVVDDQGVRYGEITQAEADCIVGGKQGCWDEAVQSFAWCVFSYGYSDVDQVPTGIVAECLSVGGETLLACVVDWIFGLFGA